MSGKRIIGFILSVWISISICTALTLHTQLDRTEETPYSRIALIITVTDEEGSPTASDAPLVTSPAASIAPITTLETGQWMTIVTPVSPGTEVPITTSLPGEGLTQTDVALMMPIVHSDWAQPLAVRGDTVNTTGWEDGITIAPDGEWLFIHYSPMTISGFFTMDPDDPTATTAYGPWQAPERPDFPDTRITSTGQIHHSFPLYGVDPAPFPIPPTCFYGFSRQPDGSFADPFQIGFDDSGNGCLGAFGLSIYMTGPGQASVGFAFDDPMIPVTGDSNSDIYQVDLNFGERTVLGSFYRDPVTFVISSENFLPTLLPIVQPGHQGNPHLHYDEAGDLTAVFVDDETAEQAVREVYVFEKTEGGGWSTQQPLPAPVNLPGLAEIQPYFDGDRMYVNREGAIVACQWRGGPWLETASWEASEIMLQAEWVFEPGRIIGLGEPTTCVWQGQEQLFFVYAVVAPDGTVDLNAGYVNRRPPNAVRQALWNEMQ